MSKIKFFFLRSFDALKSLVLSAVVQLLRIRWYRQGPLIKMFITLLLMFFVLGLLFLGIEKGFFELFRLIKIV